MVYPVGFKPKTREQEDSAARLRRQQALLWGGMPQQQKTGATKTAPPVTKTIPPPLLPPMPEYKFESGSTTPSTERFRSDYFKSKGYKDFGSTTSPFSEFYRKQGKVSEEDMRHYIEAQDAYARLFGGGTLIKSNVGGVLENFTFAAGKALNPEKPKITPWDVALDVGSAATMGYGGPAVQAAGVGVMAVGQVGRTVSEWNNMSTLERLINLGFSGLTIAGAKAETIPAIRKALNSPSAQEAKVALGKAMQELGETTLVKNEVGAAQLGVPGKTKTTFVRYGSTPGRTTVDPSFRGKGYEQNYLKSVSPEEVEGATYAYHPGQAKESRYVGKYMYIGTVDGPVLQQSSDKYQNWLVEGAKHNPGQPVKASDYALRKAKEAGYAVLNRDLEPETGMAILKKAKQLEIPLDNINTVLDLFDRNGGLTWNFSKKLGNMQEAFNGGKSPLRYAVMPFSNKDPKRIMILGQDNPLSFKSVQDFIDNNADLLADKNYHLGGWFNKNNGQGEINITRAYRTEAEAMKTAQKFNQESIFDFTGDGAVINNPKFRPEPLPPPPAAVTPAGSISPVVQGETAPITQPAGKLPPEPPKVPPTAIQGAPEPLDPLREFGQAIQSPKSEAAWKLRQKWVKVEQANRAEAAGKALEESIAAGETYEQAVTKASQMLKGKMPQFKTGIILPADVKEAAMKKIVDVLGADNIYEIKATQTALENAIADGGRAIPRVRGTAGSSAYDRLLKVFGDTPEFMDVLDGKVKLNEIMPELGIKEPITIDEALRDYLMQPTIPSGQARLGELPWTPAPIEYPGGIPPTRAQLDQQKLELTLELLKDPQGAALNAPGMFDKPDVAFNRLKQLSMFAPTTREKVMNFLHKSGVNLVDALNLPRMLVSSYDLSMPFRQGLVAGLSHPVAWAKAWKPMIQALKSEQVAVVLEKQLRSDPRIADALFKEYLDMPTIARGAKYMQKLESFASRFGEAIPGVRHSQRAATIFVEKLQHDVWLSGIKDLQKIGATAGDYKEFGHLINAAVGRGNIPKMVQSFAPTMNALLFSPRLLWARLELPLKLLSSSPYTRKEAAKMVATLLGAGSAVLGLYKMAGGKVELDPRSSEFAKMRVGDTRLDVWGGYSQYARFVAQMTTGQAKSASGNVYAQNRWDTTVKFMQSKESPAAGILTDILAGEDYAGKKLSLQPESIREQVISRIVPLFAQDLMDAYLQNGGWGALAAAPSFVGVGVVTYVDPVKKLEDSMAQEQGYQSWADMGEKAGTAAQLRVIQTSPELQQLQKEADKQYEESRRGRADLYGQWSSQAKTVEAQYQASVSLAAQEYKHTKDGVKFREKVNDAAKGRRLGYETLAQNPRLKDVVAEMSKPLTDTEKSRMNPQDIARRDYNVMLYSNDMYDQFGNYDFDKADQRTAEFVQKYGQGALDYVEQYQGIKSNMLPVEYQQLQSARATLRPYWAIIDEVWSLYPPEVRELSEQIKVVGAAGDFASRAAALRMMRGHPEILRARFLITQRMAQLRRQNPGIEDALRQFYS